tara:strand:- start:368 stop:1168 length:801 start_codon:yes stop_codon:yes gene_type:complete
MREENLVLRDLATRSVEEASAILESKGFKFTQKETKSSLSDLVTEVDQEIESVIIDFLRSERPYDSFLGEEGSRLSGSSGVKWVIDPIDGTTNFVYGIPGFGISVAAEKDGEIVAGAVADPLHSEIFDAARGFGSRCNRNTISISNEVNLGSSLIATGFSYSADQRKLQGKLLSHIIHEISDIRRIGSAAVDLCWVAAGRVDAFFEEGLNYWDYAAGSLIALEAGAVFKRIQNFLGAELIIATNPSIDDDFYALLVAAREKVVNDS